MIMTNGQAEDRYEKATFAGGCFWCMEGPFEELDGVQDVVSGYTGGEVEFPTYERVSTGMTGHAEAVQVTYDPSKVSYPELLEVFWRQVDPTDASGQFADKGSQYRTAIFYHNKEQKTLAEKSKDDLEKSGKFAALLVTEMISAGEFYRAEDYHQDYYKNFSGDYKKYKKGSGRERFLDETWGNAKTYKKLSAEELKEKLTPLQYKVTQKNGTERAFKNEYWDNKEEGIYVDVVSGEPLFSSADKYTSGTGWPSFTKPLEGGNIVVKEDRSLFTIRMEVRSKHADSHLGHIFDDGPGPAGLRYCLNSAAFRFIPKEDLDKEGYSEYKELFK
ncbi:MAG: peptide-methionine (R)-S-oxide reductase MsrB [Candidatus Tantalella remota]|nr:peptide-methionine (R)-S-oxide reductase MsrB [Candidatus Tantalella remota]